MSLFRNSGSPQRSGRQDKNTPLWVAHDVPATRFHLWWQMRLRTDCWLHVKQHRILMTLELESKLVNYHIFFLKNFLQLSYFPSNSPPYIKGPPSSNLVGSNYRALLNKEKECCGHCHTQQLIQCLLNEWHRMWTLWCQWLCLLWMTVFLVPGKWQAHDVTSSLERGGCWAQSWRHLHPMSEDLGLSPGSAPDSGFLLTYMNPGR